MSKHAIEQDIEGVYEQVSGLQREVVLKYATAPALIGTVVQLGVAEGWVPDGSAASITSWGAWAFAVIATVAGWWAARKRVTPAAGKLGPVDTDGQRLVPETAVAAPAPAIASPDLADALAKLAAVTGQAAPSADPQPTGPPAAAA